MREKKQKFKKLIIFKDERALSRLVPHQNIIHIGQAFGRLILKSSAFFFSSLFKRKEKLKTFRKLAPSSLSPPTVSAVTLMHSGYYDISILRSFLGLELTKKGKRGCPENTRNLPPSASPVLFQTSPPCLALFIYFTGVLEIELRSSCLHVPEP